MTQVTQQRDGVREREILRRLRSKPALRAIFALCMLQAELGAFLCAAELDGRCTKDAVAELAQLNQAYDLIWPSVEREIRELVAEGI